MNVLVTGASGLIGSAISKYFLSKNCFVTGIVNKESAFISNSSYKEISLDLVAESFDLEEKRFDLVVHCAAVIPNGILSVEELFNQNQRLDKTVINFCKKNKIKIIFFSTAFFYTENNFNKIYETSSLIDNLQGYYLSKKISEDYLNNSNVLSVIFRISSPYGNLQKQNNVMKIFATKIKDNLSITLIGKGERRQNFIFIEDIAEACYLAHLKTIEGTFNLAYNYSYTMLELATLIKEIYKSESLFLFDTERIEAEINVEFDNDKLKKALNWNPSYDLKAGLIKTLN